MLGMIATVESGCSRIDKGPEEARPVFQRADSEVAGQCLPEIGKRTPRPEIHARANPRARDEQRHVLA
jgi:hypothetical protein